MKLFVALLFVGLAVASPLKPLDDAFLNEHGHRVIFTEVIEKDDNFQFVEHADVVRTIGFCVRNFEKTGVSEAGQCISNSFKGRKVTLQLLKTFLKQAAQEVKADVKVDIVVSEDSSATAKDNLVTWSATGTVTVNGKAVKYAKNGGLKVNKNRVTFEELVSVDATVGDNDVKAQAALYIDVDFVTKQDGDVFQVASATNVNHGVGAQVTGSDGSVIEVGAGGHAIVNLITSSNNDDQMLAVASQGSIAGSQIFHLHKINADGSQVHGSAAKSDAIDASEATLIDTRSADIQVTARVAMGVVSHLYAGGKPAIRQYGIVTAGMTATISGTKQKFSITAQDIVASNTVLADYADNLAANVDGTASGENKVDVTVGSDKSLDVTASCSGTGKVEVTPTQGTRTTSTVTSSGTAHVTATNDGSGNIKGHADLDIKVNVHSE